VPATSASAATEIIKRFDIEFSSRVSLRHCPRRQRKDVPGVPEHWRFRGICLLNAR
jgi:hypothetical protein